MAELNIRIDVSGEELNVDHKKVNKLCEKFFKTCDKLDANPFEVGVAIGLMQEHLLKEYGCLPVTSTVMEHLKLIEETQEA